MLLPPLKLTALQQARIWGGQKLCRQLGKFGLDSENIGESWEVSDQDGASSIIQGGGFDGRSLRDVFVTHQQELMGAQAGRYMRFPLLNKFIDARDKLSVQVHPGENSPLGDAKNEAWYVVDAPEDAAIIVGIKSLETPEQILRKLKTAEAPGVLNHIPVVPGDVLYIPAGTVHAITEGLLIYEVQQNSDTTFRLYDWGRVDATGVPRPLHLEQAAAVIDYSDRTHYKIRPLEIQSEKARIRYRAANSYFALIEYCSSHGHTVELNGHFLILTCLQGKLEISGGFDTVLLNLGETLLVPAICKTLCLREMEKNSRVITSFIPVDDNEIAEPLRAAGYTENAIADLAGG